MSTRSKIIALFLALQLADLLSTLWVLHLGGYEANPLVHSLFPKFGPIATLLLVKTAVCAVVFRLQRRVPLYAVTAAYSLVVAWNALVIGIA